MNDLIAQMDALCTVFIKLAVTVVLLTLSRALIVLSKPRQTTVWASVPHTGNAATTGAVQLKFEQEAVPSVASTAPVVVAPAALVEPERIECGNCHHEIRSDPVSKAMVDGQMAVEHVCEHCGMTVRWKS